MSIRQGVRIAFMGAGGTGKTTSAREIAGALNLDRPESASREIYRENSLTEIAVLALSPEHKLDLQTHIFDRKVQNDQAYSYVTDRTILDHYAYCLAYCGGFMSDDLFEKYEEQTRSLMLSTYSHIFYFPWGYWEADGDEVRSSVRAWQSQIDSILVGYAMRWNLPVIEVPQMEGELFRSDFILSCIAGPGQDRGTIEKKTDNPSYEGC